MSTSQMLLEDRYMAERKALQHRMDVLAQRYAEKMILERYKDDVQATVRYLRELGK